MSKLRHACDVLIVGGGPAGMAAACCAAESGQRVSIVDDNPALGGQIWRAEQARPSTPEATVWFKRARSANLQVIGGARVFHQPEAGLLLAETLDGTCELSYRKLILATGARERFLPFPGWTLPNVMGAGGLQALVKSGLPIRGQKVVVAGSGPLLLAVAAYLRKRGAHVRLIAEQVSRRKLLRFGWGLLGQPRKIFQALTLKQQLAGIPYMTNCWPVAARGEEKLSSVLLRQGRRTWEVACDYLACGFYLVPNLELPSLLGCELQDEAVHVDEYQETSVPGIYCAGEPTGIGGLELSLAEGMIAGYAAAGQRTEARRAFPARARQRRFAHVLNQTFTLRDELKALPEPETLVCRCEDVSFQRMQRYDSWRAAKLQTRCGMGPCQGRICGAATEFLLGWGLESVRPPIFPVRVENLASAASAAREEINPSP
jgi:NADPH-dependent 2,4-dienoyl-CoA reductase/sulfur reductase-like enzyme